MKAGQEPQELAALLQKVMTTIMKQSMCDMLLVMRREELSMPQVVTLFYLNRRRAASISDIRSHLNLSLAATSHLTDRLVMAGLVSRTEDALDRRQKQVALTAKGTALVVELEQARLSSLVQKLGEMPDPELESTIATFTNILRYLDEKELTQELPVEHGS